MLWGWWIRGWGREGSADLRVMGGRKRRFEVGGCRVGMDLGSEGCGNDVSDSWAGAGL